MNIKMILMKSLCVTSVEKKKTQQNIATVSNK